MTQGAIRPDDELSAQLAERRPHEWSTEDQIDHYTCGACHVLATALHRLTEWQLGILWAGPRRRLDGVHHVFICLPDGSALDIHGHAALDDMRQRIAPDHWRTLPFDLITPDTLAELIGDEGLSVIGDDELGDAVEVIRRHPELGPMVAEATGSADFVFTSKEAPNKIITALPF